MTRAATLLLALLVINVLLGVICLVVARRDRASRGLRLWGAGLVVYAIGLLITIAAFLPPWLSKIAGNALICYAPILCINGALKNTTFRMNQRWVLVAFLASILPVVVNHLGSHPAVLVDFISSAPLANVLFLIGAWKLFTDPAPDARSASRFVAFAFVGSVVVWTLRVVGIFVQIGGTNDRDRADLVVALFSIAQMVMSVAATLGLLWIEVRKMQATLERIAYFDALTGLPNRRATILRFREEAARAARQTGELSMVVFDIDFFKKVNDSLGHPGGDAALVHVATLLNSKKRDEDVLGRIGGEEFVLLLPHQSAADAKEVADRLRLSVAAAPLVRAGQRTNVTVSGGVSTFPHDGDDWDELFLVADKRLYAAKHAGRNRIEGGGALLQELA
ncbi:MAG TPA: GGDEF domain-containing protein [Gemmatimonadaceae bacterium]|jgi:diguanylate cyclase (GGDEF)-like protein|nr:GGDEF domain-containing protein [Gemmatimonadaceae bacterium]